jgi:ABC-type amino acid transport substrate-binding protein
MLSHRLTSALLGGLLVVAPVLPSAARPLGDVRDSKALFIVAYEDNKPFSWTEDDGSVRGIDVELGKAIAAELGVEANVELRMQSERADGDVRVNIIRGTVGGGKPADFLMHVPVDEDFAKKFKEAVIANPYFLQTVALAVDAKKIPDDANFEIFKKEKIGVKLASVSDYFLMGYGDGALVNNIAHYTRGPVGAKEFLEGQTSALMGVRSEIEGTLAESGAKAHFIAPEMPDIIRSQWTVGIAVHENSQDLSAAIGEALAKLRSSGRMKDIFAKYGVTYLPPPDK